MAQVPYQERELLVAPPPNLSRSLCVAPLKTVRVENLHLGNSGFAGFAQRANKRGRRAEGAPHPALADVLEAFGKALFDERLGRQNQAVAIELNFQIIPRLQSQLVVNSLGNNHLPAHAELDGHRCTRLFGLCFHIFVF